MAHSLRTIRFSTEGAAQRGSALLMAVFVLVLLSAAGVSLLFMTRTELLMSQGSVRLKQVFYMAEAGEEAGRTALYLMNGRDSFTDDLQNFAGPNGQFDFDPLAVQVIYDDQGNVTGLMGFGDDRPLRPVTRFGNGWYATFLTNDPDEGVETTVDNNDLVMITGIGAGPNRSLEVVQAIVERWEVLTQMPPATITLLGPMPEFRGGHSNVHDYSGNDCAPGGPLNYVPVLGTIGDDAESSAELGIYSDETGKGGPNYEAGPFSGTSTFVDLTDPTDPILSNMGYAGPPPAWTDCEALHQMTEDFRSIADVECCNPPVCATASACVMPASSLTNVIFVDGDYEIRSPGGSGTLVVTGEVRYDGRASWDGMIFAFGAGRFVRKGAGNGHISGSVMVADIAGPDGIYGNEDDCRDGMDTALFDLSGGGNATTQYCTADIVRAWPNPPYRIVNFRQL